MNIYEIAAEAGVSISTISRVINNPEKVSPGTRKRVLDAFARNNYVPNALARGLVKSSSKNIGIISSEIRNLYYATAAHILEDCFFQWGYTSLLCPTGGSLEKKLEYVRVLAEKQVDGLVLVGSAFSSPVIEKTSRATYLIRPLPQSTAGFLVQMSIHFPLTIRRAPK